MTSRTRSDDRGTDDVIFPAYTKYGKNSLRANPHVADPKKGDLAYTGQSLLGHFGDYDGRGGSGGAAVRPALGLPKQLTPPKDALDDQAIGWL